MSKETGSENRPIDPRNAEITRLSLLVEKYEKAIDE
jgi:hypothetical protein